MGVIPDEVLKEASDFWLLPRYGGYSNEIHGKMQNHKLLPRYGGYSEKF